MAAVVAAHAQPEEAQETPPVGDRPVGDGVGRAAGAEADQHDGAHLRVGGQAALQLGEEL